MKKTILSILGLALFVFCNISCKKFLDEKPDQSLTEPRTIKDLQAMLDNGSLMNDVAPSYGETSADNYYLPVSNHNTLDEVSRKAYVWENFDYATYSNDWSLIYDVVNVANVCLSHIEQIQMTPLNETEWKNVKGSALFYRANSFFQALSIFAQAYDESTARQDFGIPLRLSSDFNVPSVRANIGDGYNRVIDDLQNAAALLNNLPQHVMRPSKAAAYALLARVYLSMRNYNAAHQYAEQCLGIQSQLMDYKTMTNLSGTSSPFIRTNPEVIFSNNSDVLVFASIATATSRIDTLLYNSYNPNDLRKRGFFRALAPGFAFKGSYSGNRSSLFVGLATDEMYLIRAESAARSGNKDSALNDLNLLLSKRYDNTFIPVTAATSQEALTIILTERRKELIYRGLRWIDIKRLNKEGANIVPKRLLNGQVFELKPNENRYALPLPKTIVDLTGMPQNPR